MIPKGATTTDVRFRIRHTVAAGRYVKPRNKAPCVRAYKRTPRMTRRIHWCLDRARREERRPGDKAKGRRQRKARLKRSPTKISGGMSFSPIEINKKEVDHRKATNRPSRVACG
jgi:hypothetical protein